MTTRSARRVRAGSAASQPVAAWPTTRLVPKLRGHEFTDTQTKVSENHLEKIRATADWIETAAATGQVDLDEQLAQLLRGQ